MSVHAEQAHAEAEAAARQRRAEQVDALTQPGHRGVVAADLAPRLAELAAPAGAPQQLLAAGDRVAVELGGLLVAIDRLAHGALLHRVVTGALEVVDRAGRVLGAAPVVGEQREVARVLPVVALVPLGDRAVQQAALGERQQLVGGLLQHDVLEAVGQLRLGSLADEQAAADQQLALLRQRRAVGLDRVDLGDHAEREHPADHAGDLERQLLLRRLLVDAADRHAVHGVGQPRERAGGGLGPQPADIAADLERAGVAQGARQLLAEERVALGPRVDQLAEALLDARDPEAPRDQLVGLRAAQGRQSEVQRPALGEHLGQLGRRVVAGLAHRQHQQQRRHPAPHRQRQRPRGRVEPLRVVEDQHLRRARDRRADQVDQQRPRVGPADHARHVARHLVSAKSSPSGSASSGAQVSPCGWSRSSASTRASPPASSPPMKPASTAATRSTGCPTRPRCPSRRRSPGRRAAPS